MIDILTQTKIDYYITDMKNVVSVSKHSVDSLIQNTVVKQIASILCIGEIRVKLFREGGAKKF